MPLDKLSTRVERFPLRSLVQLGAEVGYQNARAMNRVTYGRLVENIRRDGVLTSAPLVGRMQGDERLYVISGNHRVAAAIDAGIEESDCLLITESIPRDRFTAIQLSHNAIEGDDDATILQELYEILDLDLKQYSGLTDEDFSPDDLKVFATIGAGSPMYVQIVLGFLADDARAVEEFLKAAAGWEKKGTGVHLAPYADFDRFFDALVRVKEYKKITNSATALSALVELANERMDQIEVEEAPPKRRASK